MDNLQNNIENARKFKNVLILENLKMLKKELSTIDEVDSSIDSLSKKIEDLDSILDSEVYKKTENELAIKNNLLVLKLETIAQLKQNLYDYDFNDDEIEQLLGELKIVR